MASSVLVAKSLLCFALLAAVTAAMPARAQTMYRYKDANGVWVYTDRKPAGEQEFQQRYPPRFAEANKRRRSYARRARVFDTRSVRS